MKDESKKSVSTTLRKKESIGTVVSIAMQKTVIVSLVRVRKHPLYKKVMKHTARFAVHNEGIDVAVGDRVAITETKPMSKTKHFIVVKKL